MKINGKLNLLGKLKTVLITTGIVSLAGGAAAFRIIRRRRNNIIQENNKKLEEFSSVTTGYLTQVALEMTKSNKYAMEKTEEIRDKIDTLVQGALRNILDVVEEFEIKVKKIGKYDDRMEES